MFVVERRSVPLLSLVDLGFHELGHLLAFALPPGANAFAGSFLQIAVPVGLSAYFLFKQRDRAGGSVCLAWAATSASNVARYVADAPYERLELIGGEHDWAFLLERNLSAAPTIATVFVLLAWLLLAAGVAGLFATQILRWSEGA